MSAFRPGKTRNDPWEMTLLLLLVLLTTLTGPVLCQEDVSLEPLLDDTDADTEVTTVVLTDEDAESYTVPPSVSDSTPTQDPSIPTESNVTPVSNEIEEPGEDELSGEENRTDPEEEPTLGDGTLEPAEEGLSPTIILVPVVLVVVIIGMVVGGIVINRRCSRKTSDAEHSKADPYLDGNSTEKVPMPMFEEDVPSVLELEMEDLDEWINKDGGAAIESDHI